MAKAVLGTGHQVSLMRENVPLRLDTVCSRLKRDVHYTNGHSPSPNGHAWPETNNNTEYKLVTPVVADKMRDRPGVTIGDECQPQEFNGRETSCTGQKRRSETGLDVVKRKRRRKNCQPRSLMQLNHEQEELMLKEQLSDYRVNNSGVDFDTIADDEEEILDLSCGKKQEDLPISSNSDKHVTDDTVVDLSIVTHGDPPEVESAQNCSRLVTMDTTTEDDDGAVKTAETTPSGAEAAVAIKDYAETTMNELLSIYGLSEDEAGESITRRVPLQNFAPSNILGRELHLLASPPTPATFPSTHPSKKSARPAGPTTSVEASVCDSAALSVSATSLASDGIYGKFMDRVETLTQTPQGMHVILIIH